MGLWIELHCDVKDMDHVGPDKCLACWTHRNANEAMLVEATAQAARAAVAALKQSARAKGWKPTGEGWTCPSCAARPAERAEHTRKNAEEQHADTPAGEHHAR